MKSKTKASSNKSARTICPKVTAIHLPQSVLDQGGIVFVKVGTPEYPASKDDLAAVAASLRDVVVPNGKLKAVVCHHAIDVTMTPSVNSVNVV